MKLNEGFIKELCVNIYELTNQDVLQDDKKLDKLSKLLSIYNSIKNIEVYELQSAFMKQSNDAFQNVDFSKMDIKGILSQLVGK